MRISVGRDASRQAGHAGMLWRSASGETRAGQVEGSPEEVDGAHFAGESGAEDGEDARGLQQDVPEALRIFGVITLVGEVLVEGNGFGDLSRDMPDVYRNAEAFERGLELLIERGHGHRLERDSLAARFAGLKDEQVVEEIEIDLYDEGTVSHGRGGDASNGGVESDAPAMVDGRREGEPDFANDLHPELQGSAGVVPRALGQSGPSCGIGCGMVVIHGGMDLATIMIA